MKGSNSERSNQPLRRALVILFTTSEGGDTGSLFEDLHVLK